MNNKEQLHQNFLKDFKELLEKYDATIQELNDDILRYQKHLSNLNKIKEKLQ